MFRRAFFLPLVLIFLSSCESVETQPPLIASPVIATLAASSATSPATETLLPPTETPAPPTSTPAPRIDRVLIVTFDGLRPDTIAAAEMDNMLALMQSGAYTLTAKTIMPSSTLPAHSSMVVGTCPSKHIVRWNEFVPQNGYAIGTDVFDLAHAAGLQTALIVGKEKISQITEPTSLDYFALVDKTDKIDDPYSIEELAIAQIMRGFNLMLVHFPDGDLAGHEFGWGTPQQLRAYAKNDRALGGMIQALKNYGLYESTIIIVTSDHGGHGTTHGMNIPEDITIPWVISGPRVQPHQLTTQIHVMDTAVTAAFALGLPIQPEWDGAPALEAFGLPITAKSEDCK